MGRPSFGFLDTYRFWAACLVLMSLEISVQPVCGDLGRLLSVSEHDRTASWPMFAVRLVSGTTERDAASWCCRRQIDESKDWMAWLLAVLNLSEMEAPKSLTIKRRCRHAVTYKQEGPQSGHSDARIRGYLTC